MAGNRARQRAFQIPLLIELAVIGGKVNARRMGRRKSEEVEEVINWVLSYFSFSAEQRRQRHSSNGQTVLENDVLWARKQLVEAGLIKHVKEDKWKISDAGLEHLRKYLANLVRKGMEDEELDAVMMEQNYNDEELLLQALKMIAKESVKLPNYSLETLLMAGSSLRHVFRNAVANLPATEVGNLLLFGYEPLKPFISRDMAKRHGLAAA